MMGENGEDTMEVKMEAIVVVVVVEIKGERTRRGRGGLLVTWTHGRLATWS